MIELWQTEWCPASRRVRQRLTELDVTYVVHQVPVAKIDRTALVAATGADTIPALVPDDATPVLVGEDAIGAWLDASFAEPAGAADHRAKAEKARRREVQEAAEAFVRTLSPPRSPQEVSR